MNKVIRKIMLIVLVIIILFLIIVITDCIRIKNSPINTKPIVTIGENISDTETIYYGIGYSIKYYKIENTFGNGADFRLFNVISIWSWEAQ